jgi:hypothetical protein
LNDALNAVLWPDEVDPRHVIRGSTDLTPSKHGLPLQLYAPASGWLGDFEWWPEHLAEVAGLEYAIPDYVSTPAATPSAPGTVILPFVASPEHARSALRDICAQPPLCMPEEEFAELHLTTHSIHGTACDLVRFLAAVGLPFSEPDARATGHWLADRNAPQPDARKIPGAPSRRQPDGAPVSHGGMSFRYSQGEGRRGEREEQLDVRSRLNAHLRERLAAVPGGWWTLPRTTESWDVLRPPA